MGRHTEPRAHPPVGATDETSQPSGKEIIAELGRIAEKLDKVDINDVSKITARAGEAEKPISDRDEAAQEAVMERVAKFLNPKTAGPIYMIPVRGKVFVGRLLTAQEALEVERRAGMVPGRAVTTGQVLTAWINELLGGSYGYVRQGTPEEQAVRAHLDDPDKWPQLHDVEWLNTRDPFLRGEEIEPLWFAYSKWKSEVTPTADEIRFYYSRVG